MHPAVPAQCGLDAPRGDHGRVQTRAAEPVDGGRRDSHRKPGQQACHSTEISVVFSGIVRVAEDHFIDRAAV